MLASPSYTDVTAAVASASDGDTVMVPAGTASWTSTLTITKGIALIGATTITGTTQTRLLGITPSFLTTWTAGGRSHKFYTFTPQAAKQLASPGSLFARAHQHQRKPIMAGFT